MRLRKRNETLEKQYRDQGSCCYYCKKEVPYELITRDHINPVSKGSNLIKNKIYACVNCNSYKGDKTFEEFRAIMIKKSCRILGDVVNQGFKISQEQLDKIRYFVAVMNTVSVIIENDNTPEVVFT